MIISFIYKIKDSDIKYYGKYIGYIKTTYEEGLDVELSNTIYPYIKTYYDLDNEDQLSIGIIGFNRDVSDYFSEKEKDVFDFLYCDWSSNKELFINKKQII